MMREKKNMKRVKEKNEMWLEGKNIKLNWLLKELD